MNKVMRKNHANITLVLINASLGIALWLITAGVMSWFLSSEWLNEQSAIVITPIAQGIIAYVITTTTYFGMREERPVVPLLTPGIYFITQLVVALLFWNANLNGVIRGGVAVACGVVLAFITYKSKGSRRKRKLFINRSR